MKKKEDYALDVKFANLKDLFKSKSKFEDGDDFDELSREMLKYMGELTINGVAGSTITALKVGADPFQVSFTVN